MAIQEFDNDDEYIDWQNNNPSYFIANTRRSKKSNYFVLHKSKCSHILSKSGFINEGIFTERDNIKIGSNDINELKLWFIKNKIKFKGVFTECKTCTPFSEKYIDHPVFLYADIVEDEKTILFEGAKKQIVVNAYERNTKARQKCLAYYGHNCSVCNMDFEKAYGIIGKGFIHVHHLKEIHSIGNIYQIDPIVDLRPVCPNCHSMLHQRIPCFTIDELKQILLDN
jgi:5-methylcytosine-specific restriction protein A